MLALKEKNPFHQNDVDILKTVGVLAVIPGRLFGEIGNEVDRALFFKRHQQFGKEFIEANRIVVEVCRGLDRVEASVGQIKPAIGVDVSHGDRVLAESGLNLFSDITLAAAVDAAYTYEQAPSFGYGGALAQNSRDQVIHINDVPPPG